MPLTTIKFDVVIISLNTVTGVIYAFDYKLRLIAKLQAYTRASIVNCAQCSSVVNFMRFFGCVFEGSVREMNMKNLIVKNLIETFSF